MRPLEECPAASTTALAATTAPSASVTPHASPVFGSRFTRAHRTPNLNSTPSPSKYFLAVRKIRTKRSVPKCGLPSTRMFSGAPNATSACNTARTRSLFRPIRVVSFPSDHVPAPPSP